MVLHLDIIQVMFGGQGHRLKFMVTHNCFTALFSHYPGEPVPEEKLLLDFIVQGKIT